MKTFVRLVLTALATASLLRAHPGHDGDHGLTWDFTHLAGHPLATLGWALVGVIALGTSWLILRRREQQHLQSLRGSAASRGK